MKKPAGTSFSQPPILPNGSGFLPLSVSTCVEIISLQLLGRGKVQQYLDRLHIYLTSKICSHSQGSEKALSHRWKIQCRIVLCYLAKLRMESLLIKHYTPMRFYTLSCLSTDSRTALGYQTPRASSSEWDLQQHSNPRFCQCPLHHRHCLCSGFLPAKIPR